MYWCKFCHGELVSCECSEEIYADDDYVAEEYLAEDIDDRMVVWSVNDSGVGRIEVLR